MITEVSPTVYAIKINGVITQSNIQTRTMAEAMVLNLPTDLRAIAEVVPVTTDGKQFLLG